MVLMDCHYIHPCHFQILIQMIQKHYQPKVLTKHQTNTFEDQMQNIKKISFKLLNAFLAQNKDASPGLFYMLMGLQHLALLSYILHPQLNIYSKSSLINLNIVLSNLNFDDLQASSYQSILVLIVFYLLIQIALVIISSQFILQDKVTQLSKYLTKIVNYQLIITAKVLSGPFLAIIINIIYCDAVNGPNCSGFEYLLYCIVAGLAGAIIAFQVLIISLIYFNRNPLCSSFMGVPNRFHMISKTILKILMAVYFTIDAQYHYRIVYMFGAVVGWGGYLWWHRVFSTHSYCQNYFYVEYFMEIVIFWFSLSNVVYYYVSSHQLKELSFGYTFISAILFSLLCLSIEHMYGQEFMHRCLSKKIRRADIQRFIFTVINRLVFDNDKSSKIKLRVYFKLINQHLALSSPFQGEQQDHQQQVYQFLLNLIQAFIQQNKSVMMRTVKCHLLSRLRKKTYGLHQSLMLQEERLSLIEQFTLFQFRQENRLFQAQNYDQQSRKFIKFYKYNQEYARLEQYIEECSTNNTEYWEEVCQSQPSLSKLRNLSTISVQYFTKIDQQYIKIHQIIPDSIFAVNLYFNFLINTGVDVDATLKLKEKLNSLISSKNRKAKITYEQIKQTQKTSLITLDSVGNRLGIILNCNSYVKNIIGLQKNELIGKNITRIMPKVYAEIHSGFMLSFIQSQNSHEQVGVKEVAALNTNSLLVQVTLSVRVFNNLTNQLILVGFMKKNQIQHYEGFVMYSQTGLIMGVDEHFVNFMNKTIEGKQFIREEIRLQTLMPNIDISELDNQQEQSTLLQIGCPLEDESQIQVKKVRVRVKRTINRGVRINFLSVIQQDWFDRAQNKLTQQINTKQMQQRTRQLLSGTKSIKQQFLQSEHSERKRQSINFSINISQSQKLIKESTYQDLYQVAPHAKKLQQYIQNHQNNNLRMALRIIYIVCIIGCSGISLYTYASHSINLARNQTLYHSINQSLSIAFYEASINKQVGQIWNNNTLSLSRSDQDFQHLRICVMLLKSSYSRLVRDLANFKYGLEYNEQNHYNITFWLAINNTMVPSTRSTLFSDAMSNYLAAANAFLLEDQLLSQKQALEIQASSMFIHCNGASILPSIAIKAADRYGEYFAQVLRQQVEQLLILKSVLMLVIVLCYVCLIFLVKYFNKINGQVVHIYKTFKIVDIYLLLNKYHKFLQQKDLRVPPLKPRPSVFINVYQSKQKSSPILNTKRQRPMIKNSNSSFQPPLITEQPLVSKGNEARLVTESDRQYLDESFDKEEEDFLNSADKEDQLTTKIATQPHNSKILVIILLILISFIILLTVSYLVVANNISQIQSSINRLKALGFIKTSLKLIDYYSVTLLAYPHDTLRRALLTKQIHNFYTLTQQNYIYLGDPFPVLKNTYNLVQLIQQELAAQNIGKPNKLNETYISEGFNSTIIDINNIDSTIYFPEFADTNRTGSMRELLMTFAVIVWMFITVLFMHYYYVLPILKKGESNLNMLRMLPSELIHKNTKVLQLIDLL